MSCGVFLGGVVCYYEAYEHNAISYLDDRCSGGSWGILMLKASITSYSSSFAMGC